MILDPPGSLPPYYLALFQICDSLPPLRLQRSFQYSFPIKTYLIDAHPVLLLLI